mmetsp:Transcript_17634/g.52704  ORF Transcript_17634/g.52704 Transcript_17634/m.52704 type:complete len:213 (-) Transcript_17634:48-686(-)
MWLSSKCASNSARRSPYSFSSASSASSSMPLLPVSQPTLSSPEFSSISSSASSSSSLSSLSSLTLSTPLIRSRVRFAPTVLSTSENARPIDMRSRPPSDSIRPIPNGAAGLSPSPSLSPSMRDSALSLDSERPERCSRCNDDACAAASDSRLAPMLLSIESGGRFVDLRRVPTAAAAAAALPALPNRRRGSRDLSAPVPVGGDWSVVASSCE